jgi:hypothetical protein
MSSKINDCYEKYKNQIEDKKKRDKVELLIENKEKYNTILDHFQNSDIEIHNNYLKLKTNLKMLFWFNNVEDFLKSNKVTSLNRDKQSKMLESFVSQLNIIIVLMNELNQFVQNCEKNLDLKSNTALRTPSPSVSARTVNSISIIKKPEKSVEILVLHSSNNLDNRWAIPRKKSKGENKNKSRSKSKSKGGKTLKRKK